jgi:hypothetical protein
LFGGISLFRSRPRGESTDDYIEPKAINPAPRVRTNPADEYIESPVAPRRGKGPEDPSNQSSNEGRDRTERAHRSRRHSHSHHQRFQSQEEEAEYYRRKEERRAARREAEVFGAHDGGISLAPPRYDPPPPPEQLPEEIAPPRRVKHVPDPFVDDSAGVTDAPSGSSSERRHRSRRAPVIEDRPRARRTVSPEKERPSGRRVESDRPARVIGEERPRARRSETERRGDGAPRRRRESEGGLKSLLGGFMKRS